MLYVFVQSNLILNRWRNARSNVCISASTALFFVSESSANSWWSGDVTVSDTTSYKTQQHSPQKNSQCLPPLEAALCVQLTLRTTQTTMCGLYLSRTPDWGALKWQVPEEEKEYERNVEWYENNQFPSQPLAGPLQGLPWDNLSTVQESQKQKSTTGTTDRPLREDRDFLCTAHNPHTAGLKVK